MPNAKQIAEEMRKQEIPEAPGLADFARRMKQILVQDDRKCAGRQEMCRTTGRVACKEIEITYTRGEGLS